MALVISQPIRRGRKPRLGREMKSRKADEMILRNGIQQELFPVLDWLANNPEVDIDVYADLRKGLTDKVRPLVEKWLAGVNAANRDKVTAQLKTALGIDTCSILDDEKVAGAVKAMADSAVDLIAGDLDFCKDKIKQAVLANLQGIEQPEGRSLAEQIQHITGIGKSRARLIARDQTHKANIAITQQRQTALGITQYVWRTSKDERVVGNPGGLYPQGNRVHGNHWERDGKVFNWDDPPFDGHPGYAINCRCTAQPVVDLSKMDILAPER